MAENEMPIFSEYHEEAQGRANLKGMLHHERHGPEEILVPVRVEVSVAEEVLDDEVTSSIKPEQTHRAGNIACFYGLSSVVSKFADLLDRRERDLDACIRSIECLRVMGEIGDSGQQRTAAEYYDYLLHHRIFVKLVDRMIECYFYLDSSVTDETVGKLIDTRIKKIKDDKTEDGGPTNEYIDLAEHRQATLPVTKQAKTSKERLLAQKEPKMRVFGLVRHYVGITSPGGINWPEWSSFAIMREVLTNGPKLVIEGFETALTEIDPEKEEKEYVAYARRRATRALMFYGATVPDEKKAWAQLGETAPDQLQG